jgi:hypothetical protein
MKTGEALAGIAILISLIALAVSTSQTWRAAVSGRRPVLVFVYDQSAGWVVRNIGNGPAMNVIIAQKGEAAPWVKPVRIPPLATNSEFVLAWLDHNVYGLGATYMDFTGRPYTSTCVNDLSETTAGRAFGPWRDSEIERHWNARPRK